MRASFSITGSRFAAITSPLSITPGTHSMRWPKIGLASASTSSGVTWSRPRTSARACSAGSISTSERVDAPCSTRSSARSARARSTSASRIGSAMCTPCLIARRAASRSARDTRGRPELMSQARPRILAQHVELGRALDVLHLELEQEAIELRRRQRIRAGDVERVLRGDHEEQLVERVRLVVDRDLLLGHRLEHRRLHLGRGAVDLVGEHDVREDRPGPEREAAVLELEHARAGDVARQQVGRELDAPERRDAVVGPAVVPSIESPRQRASVVLPEPG